MEVSMFFKQMLPFVKLLPSKVHSLVSLDWNKCLAGKHLGFWKRDGWSRLLSNILVCVGLCMCVCLRGVLWKGGGGGSQPTGLSDSVSPRPVSIPTSRIFLLLGQKGTTHPCNWDPASGRGGGWWGWGGQERIGGWLCERGRIGRHPPSPCLRNLYNPNVIGWHLVMMNGIDPYMEVWLISRNYVECVNKKLLYHDL